MDNKNINIKEDDVLQWHTQTGNITTYLKVNMGFTWPKLMATKSMMCDFFMDNLSRERYDMVLNKYLITALKLKLKFSEHVIESDNGPLKGSLEPMVDFYT